MNRLPAEENQRRLNAYNAHMSDALAAEALGIKLHAFRDWRRDRDLPSRRAFALEADDAEAIRVYRLLPHDAAISQALGWNAGDYHAWRRARRLPMKRETPDCEERTPRESGRTPGTPAGRFLDRARGGNPRFLACSPERQQPFHKRNRGETAEHDAKRRDAYETTSDDDAAAASLGESKKAFRLWRDRKGLPRKVDGIPIKSRTARPTPATLCATMEGTLGDLQRQRADDPDVDIHLPPVRRIVHEVDKDTGKYDRLIQKAVALAHQYAGTKDWQMRGQIKSSFERAARSAVGEAKAPYVAAFVRTLLEAGEVVIVCAFHHVVHNILNQELKEWNPLKLTGRESQKQKDEAKQAFIDGKSNLVQLALRSASGMDGFQRRATVIVFAELDWSPAIHTQAEGRIRRIGVDEKVENILSYYMVTDTGTDATMREALGLKVGQFIGLMGDKAESEEDKMLANVAAEKHVDKLILAMQQLPAPPQQVVADEGDSDDV